MHKERDTSLQRSYSRGDRRITYRAEVTIKKQKGGGINASRIPPHPPSRKAVTPDRSRGGLRSESRVEVAL